MRLRDPLFFSDRSYWKGLLTLGVPMALQNLISTSLNLTDNLMVGQLGEKALGALAVANQLTFLSVLFLYGIGSGAAVFAAQFWGARDLAGVRKTQGAVLLLAVVPALVFGPCVLSFPRRSSGSTPMTPRPGPWGRRTCAFRAWAFRSSGSPSPSRCS